MDRSTQTGSTYTANTTGANWAEQRERFEQLIEQGPEQRAEQLQAMAQQSPALAEAMRDLLLAHDKFAGITNQQSHALLEQAQQFVATEQQQSMNGMSVGAYQLVEEIGRGGMGTVWRAERRDGAVVQNVAIKLLPPHLWDSHNRKRFQAERQIVASLDHPNIAKLLDAGEVQGQPFFVMELVNGVSIVEYSRQQKLTPRGQVALLQSALRALDYAHRNLVVHRDLKPANILVTTDGTVKLIDFGIAKLLSDATETATAQRFFSPNYAAPEQLLGKQQSVSVDVYQMGAVLYQLLAGKPPFDFSTASPAEIEASILHRVPKIPDAKQPDLSAVALKALRKETNERYASIAELSEDLHRYLTHRPITARSGQFWYRTQKFLRRNAVAVAASTAFAVTATGFAWHAYSQQIEIAKQRDLAVEEKQNAEAVTGFLVESFSPPDPTRGWAKNATVVDLLANARLRALASSESKGPGQFRILEAVFNAQASSGYVDGQADVFAILDETARQYPELGRDALRARVKFLQGTNSSKVDRGELYRIIELLAAEGPSEDLVNAQFALVQSLLVSSKSNQIDQEVLMLSIWSEGMKLPLSLRANIDVTISRYWSEVRGDHRKAEFILKTALAKVEYSTPVLRALILRRLSVVMSKLKSFDVGYEFARESLAIYDDIYEETNSLVIGARNNLAAAAQDARRFEEAEELYNNVRNITKRMGSDMQPEYLLTSFNLANLYAEQGRLDDAIELMDEVVESSKLAFTADDWRRRMFQLKLLELYFKSKQCDQAFFAVESFKASETELDEIAIELRQSCASKKID